MRTNVAVVLVCLVAALLGANSAYASQPMMYNDIPLSGAVVQQPFAISGWAVDLAAPTGCGVDTIHIWAYPSSGGPAVFVGVPEFGYRPDVGAAFGDDRFSWGGYGIMVNGLSVGSYQIVVYAHSTVTGTFNQAFSLNVTIVQSLTYPWFVGIQGSRFTINSTPTFLVFVDYFDALDVPDERALSDFAAFAELGFNGIRIFPNWWTINPDTYAGDTVIDPDGNIREENFENLLWYISRARLYGLVVDLSFSAESVAALCGGDDCPAGEGNEGYASLTLDEARNGIQQVAARLAGQYYTHVIFDIQNESNIIGPLWHSINEPDLSGIIQAVRAVTPGRIVMASVDQNCPGACAAGRAINTAQDVVASHESREPNFWNGTFSWVQNIRQYTSKPVYLQEPEKYKDETAGWMTASGLRHAVKEAKRAGAAAWTFHTDAGRWMNQVGFFNSLSSVESEFINTFAAELAAAPWGQ